MNRVSIISNILKLNKKTVLSKALYKIQIFVVNKIYEGNNNNNNNFNSNNNMSFNNYTGKFLI
jgi:hypothetical protein